MDDSVAGLALAAGAGRRLRPLTDRRPKAMCPVGGVPLVDLALERLAMATSDVAVNLHHHAGLLDRHLPPSVHRSVEEPEALGTAGALGALRPWIDGRAVLVTNADAWLGAGLDLEAFVQSWDRERIRLLCVDDEQRGDFGDLRYCGVALMPWSAVVGLDAVPSGLYEASWRRASAEGRLDLVRTDAPFVDCGTPADYLAANLAWSGGASVVSSDVEVGPGAKVDRSVVWAGSTVAAGEVLVDAVRGDAMTVLVRGTISGGQPTATERGS